MHSNSKSWSPSHICDRIQLLGLEDIVVAYRRPVVFTYFLEEMGPLAPTGALTHTTWFIFIFIFI